VIPFDFVELILCYFYVVKCDDPICVHLVSKCKIINNALILGELSYICYNTLLCLFQLVLIIVGRQIFSFWYLVCHHKKCGEFGLLLEPFSLWEFVISFLVIFFTLKMRYVFGHVSFSYFMLIGFWFVHLLNFGANLVLIGFFDIVWTTFSFHTFVWLLGLLGVLFNCISLWLLKVLCMHSY
jgi:hypothetical protein